jgi:PleD family two-component response regulator
VALIKQHLRPYDLIIRLGGDEFLGAISNITVVAAHRRFSKIQTELAGAADVGAIRIGFAELSADESASELIARADSEMIASRDEKRSNRGQQPSTGSSGRSDAVGQGDSSSDPLV